MPRTRVWHQSYTDLTTLPVYAQRIRDHAEQTVARTVTVDVFGLPEGIPTISGISSVVDRLEEELEICRAVKRAADLGYDAVVLGCIYDPALEDARALVDIPVLGMAETTLQVAVSVGRRLGLISLTEADAIAVERRAIRLGHREPLAASVSLEPEWSEQDIEHLGESQETRLWAAVEAATRACLAAGADIVIPAEGVLNEFVVAFRDRVGTELPLMDAFGVLWLQAAAFTEMRRSLPRRRSSRQADLPPWDEVHSVQRFFAEYWSQT